MWLYSYWTSYQTVFSVSDMGLHWAAQPRDGFIPGLHSITLFILKINSITDAVSDGFDKSLFMNDFSVACSSPHTEKTNSKLYQ